MFGEIFCVTKLVGTVDTVKFKSVNVSISCLKLVLEIAEKSVGT